MLSILAKSFMVATQTDGGTTPQNHKPSPEDYWWMEKTRVTRSRAK
ncbi:hypothetical protein RUE5091_03368 [Ruegeria denitrificans]|uniref:Uncharacterized protein n=1 Tax=Ruegeria denitrificans TaxID=1715692 RepID=A0A0P1ILP7_9RHOB|nr:hypothetical protein [Ruegeria denitrificans]CUK11037.1 hypothetical protein RUE5091_03368 [Ruegeria denitrificans]